MDPDTFNLYITAHVSPELIVSTRHRTSPAAIYMDFQGQGTEMEAPEWTAWTPGAAQTVWMKRGYVANLFVTLALHRINLARVSRLCDICRLFHTDGDLNSQTFPSQ